MGSDRQLERLQRKRERLEDKCDVWDEKHHALEKEAILETDAAKKFKLDQDLEVAAAEIERLNQQIEQLNRQIAALEGTVDLQSRSPFSTQQLHEALLKLGYRQQVRLFRRLIAAHSVAAFLIHGEMEYGQRWLLNRLVSQYLPDWFTGKVVKVNVSRKVRRSDASALWRELGRRVGLRGNEFDQADIAEGVYRWWQTQDVLLVFHDVDFLPKEGFDQLVQEFWLPLASRARQAQANRQANQPVNQATDRGVAQGSTLGSQGEESRFKLLMFMVDYDGRVGEWDVPFVEKLEANWQPATPVKAPKLDEFSDDELTDWLEQEYSDLPRSLTAEIDGTVQEILHNSDDGIPERALEEICDRTGFNWYELRDRWQKL